jgi:hypothetical protein
MTKMTTWITCSPTKTNGANGPLELTLARIDSADLNRPNSSERNASAVAATRQRSSGKPTIAASRLARAPSIRWNIRLARCIGNVSGPAVGLVLRTKRAYD